MAGESCSKVIAGSAAQGDLIDDFHYMMVVFVTMILVMLGIGAVKPKELVETEVKEEDAVDMTPWKGRKIAAAMLCVIVLLIYAVFADFSVWY